MTAASLADVTAGQCAPPVRLGTPRRRARGYAAGKDDYLIRLRKIEGQVLGLQKMIENDNWCPDIVIQISSVTWALQEVAVGLVSDHLRHCVASAIRKPGSAGERGCRRGKRPGRRVTFGALGSTPCDGLASRAAS